MRARDAEWAQFLFSRRFTGLGEVTEWPLWGFGFFHHLINSSKVLSISSGMCWSGVETGPWRVWCDCLFVLQVSNSNIHPAEGEPTSVHPSLCPSSAPFMLYYWCRGSESSAMLKGHWPGFSLRDLKHTLPRPPRHRCCLQGLWLHCTTVPHSEQCNSIVKASVHSWSTSVCVPDSWDPISIVSAVRCVQSSAILLIGFQVLG